MWSLCILWVHCGFIVGICVFIVVIGVFIVGICGRSHYLLCHIGLRLCFTVIILLI